MTSCGPYKPTAGGCTPHTEVFWARKESDASPVLLYLQVTCVAGKAVKTLTTDKAGTTPAVGYTEADKIGTVIKGERGASCEDPVHVEVCEPETTIKALDSASCDGTTKDIVVTGLAKQVVNAPGTALSVKLCGPTANLKIEFSEVLMYSASTEQALFRIREYNEDLGTWSLRYESLDGTLYVGALPADLVAQTAQVNVVQTSFMGCTAGVPTEQKTTSRFDAETGMMESESVVWVAGGVTSLTAPVGFVLESCAALATAASLALLLAEQDKELTFTTPVQICVGGVSYLVRQRSVYDSEAATPVSLVPEYTTDGVTWTATAPVGTITLGECPKCAVTEHLEFAYYRTPESTGLQNMLGMHQSVNADFTQSLAGDFEFYLVVDGVPQLGNGAGAGYAAQYPLQFMNLQAVANWLNSHPANTAPKDNWVVGVSAGNQYLAISNTAGGAASNHQWNDMVLAHYVSAGNIDYNIFKSSPEYQDVDATIPATCRKIEVIKERDSCTKAITLYGYELSGNAIAAFDANNVFAGEAKSATRQLCATMTSGETWNIREVTEVTPCGDATLKYFDPDVSPMVEIDSALIASIKYEGECDCCNTTSTVLPPMAQRRSYTGNLTGLSYVTDKFTNSANLQWQVKVIKNGVDVVNSPVSPALTTLPAAVAWLNSASQGYFTINATGVGNGRMFDYTAPDNSGTDEYLIIVRETVVGYNGLAGTSLTTPQDFSFTNRGSLYGAGNSAGGTGSVDYADSIGNPMDWATRASYGWQAN